MLCIVYKYMVHSSMNAAYCIELYGTQFYSVLLSIV